jgi:hypothetical protein
MTPLKAVIADVMAALMTIRGRSMSNPDPLQLNTCLVCGGTPAGLYFALPPADRVVKKANGQTIPYTLCAACAALPDAGARIDAALRAREGRA